MRGVKTVMSSQRPHPRGRWPLLATGLGLVVLVAPLLLDPAPRLVWNATASAPVGLWRVRPGAMVGVGDTVLAWAPPPARRFAAARGYLPANVPMIKTVAAAQGDVVCAFEASILVNGKVVALRRSADLHGRALPWWRGCQILDTGAVMLLNSTPDSFDGRYFGAVEKAAVIGEATPLWLP